MKLNHQKKARTMVNSLLAKNGKTAREISAHMGYKQRNEVSKILGTENRHVKLEKLTEIVQAINPNYRIRTEMISPTNYQVVVIVKNSPQIVHSYFVDETVHPPK